MFDNETTIPGIDAETFDQFAKLLDVPKPAHEAFHDGEPVTLSLTKGQVFVIRGILRGRVAGTLDELAAIERLGAVPDDEEAEHVNRYMATYVVIDGQLARAADVSEYPADDQEPALV